MFGGVVGSGIGSVEGEGEVEVEGSLEDRGVGD